MIIDIYNTDKKYKTIYADPPWNERGGGKVKRGADRHYNLMQTDEICKIPVSEIVDKMGCHLYLWATNNHMKDAFRVLDAWGFEYVTMITWLKGDIITENGAEKISMNRLSLGQYYRGATEHCLFGATKNRLPYKLDENNKRMQGKTAIIAPKREHSRKPEGMRDMIERVSYKPAIELFARCETEGWDAWGG